MDKPSIDSVVDQVGVEVQIRFEPQLIDFKTGTDVILNLVPFGNYTPAQIEYLHSNPLKIDARFLLQGFKADWVNFMCLSLDFTGEEIEAKKHIIPGPRVVGTLYREMISVNNSLKFHSKGNFAPLPEDKGFYLIRVPDSEKHLISGEYFIHVFDF
jgi:hypothetical protein